MLPGITGMMSGVSATVVASFVGAVTTPTNADPTFTFASASLGSGPYKIINVHWTGNATNRTLSSITVDGNAATIIEQDSHTGGSTHVGAAIAIIQFGASSGDVVCTFSGGLGFAVPVSIGVFSVNGIPNATPFDFEEVRGSGDTSVTDQINIPEGGFLILCGTGSTNTDPYAMAFTGATEVYDSASNFTGRYGGALSTSMSAETNRNIGLTMTDGVGDVDDSGVELIAVSFGP